MRAETLHALLLLALIVGLGASIFAYAESVDVSLQRDCSVNVFFSCSKVDQSGQTTTLGLPDYAWGIGGFLAMLALDIPLYVSWRASLLRALAALSGLGVLLSADLTYIELVRIDALCPVCLTAYLSNLLAFLLFVALLHRGRRGTDELEEELPGRSEGRTAPARGDPPAGGTTGGRSTP